MSITIQSKITLSEQNVKDALALYLRSQGILIDRINGFSGKTSGYRDEETIYEIDVVLGTSTTSSPQFI